MIDINEIENTIAELENSSTTFANCQKLANLYIVKEHLQNNNSSAPNEVVKEYKDILPMYSRYCEIKRKYQDKEITEDAVINAMYDVSTEIKEFIRILYANVDTQGEKQILTNMIAELKTLY